MQLDTIKEVEQRVYTEDDFLYQAQYDIRHSEIDKCALLKPTALWSYMLETSMRHVKSLKLSYWDMKELGVTWALRRGHFHVDRYPDVSERLRVVTYSHSTRRYFTHRDYRVYDQNNTMISWMASEWFLMGTQNRGLCDIMKTLGILPNNDTVTPLNSKLEKVRAPEGHHYSENIPVRYHHIDFNGHVSNAAYLQWMTDQMPDKVLRNMQLSDFYIQYSKEIMEGQSIKVGYTEEQEDQYVHFISDPDGDPLALAKSVWRARI